MSTSNAAGVMCSIVSMNLEMGPLIVGYEVLRFGVPMVGEYDNVGIRRTETVTISPVVPGTNYRIEGWALSNGRRNAAPAVKKFWSTEVGKLSNALNTIDTSGVLL